jgi:multidrug resistance efflux pump
MDKSTIHNNLEHHHKGFHSFNLVYRAKRPSRVKYWFWSILIVGLGILLLPWTQNIRAKGKVTTLRQEQRPQEINSIIAGKIIKWYVKEGDQVNAGDTLAQLAEIKDAYLDQGLIGRTQEQLNAKQSSINFYNQKVNAGAQQINALNQARDLKQAQLQNKVRQSQLKILSDSMEMVAARNDYKYADNQYRRQKVMYDSGIASLLQLEQRNQAYQNALAKRTAAEIKYTNTKTDYLNTQVELSQVAQDYAEKISKIQGEQASAQSDIAGAQGEVAKINNQLANYKIRAGQYYIIAPQEGQVVQAAKGGLNEIVKEGEKLLEIVPQKVEYAVELFIEPVDLPLVNKGQKVRFFFDGFPAIVFSGWPQASYGTFGGTVVALENNANNGKFRVLVAPDAQDKIWPPSLKIGAGAQGFALLKNVPIYYELWRNINGFPPNFYKPQVNDNKDKDK